MILQACSISAGYRDHPVLDDLTLDVPTHTHLALLGANGSGKTTLLRCLSGAMTPTAGRILYQGQPLRHTKDALRTHRSRVQLVLQDPDDQLFSADVYADVSFGPLNQGLSDDEARARVDATLAALHITHLAERPTHQLSYGEKKKVAIAGAVAMRPEVLLLDEPTAGLDPVGVDDLLATLNSVAATIVIATHDVNVAYTWANTFAIVNAGRVVQGDANLFNDADLIGQARLKKPWRMLLEGGPIE